MGDLQLPYGPDIPRQYALVLKPCLKANCDHLVCRAAETTVSDETWFSDGPPLYYFPFPIPDPSRPWRRDCNSYFGVCVGTTWIQRMHGTHLKKWYSSLNGQTTINSFAGGIY